MGTATASFPLSTYSRAFAPPRERAGTTYGSLRWDCALFLALMALCLIPKAGQCAALICLCVLAFSSAHGAARALIFVGPILFFNPSLMGMGATLKTLTPVTVAKWTLLLIVFITTLVRFNVDTRGIRDVLIWLALLLGAAAGISAAVSADVLVSFLKLGVFAICVVACVLLYRICRHRSGYYVLLNYCAGSLVALLSLPILALPAGRAINGTAFQGILNESQALGIYLVPIVCMGVAALAFKIVNGRLALAAFCMTGLTGWLMFETRARTAMLATVLTLVAIFLEAAVGANRKRWRLNSLRVSALLVLAFAGVLYGVFYEDLPGQLQAFVEKGSNAGSYLSVDVLSSGDLVISRKNIVNHLETLIADHVWTGVGFGMDEEEEFTKPDSDTLMNLPLSAPVEQSFLPLAVWAQIGLIGSVFVYGLILSLYRKVRRSADPVRAALFLGCLLVNLGEMIFFSPGGLGLGMWAALATSIQVPAAPAAE